MLNHIVLMKFKPGVADARIRQLESTLDDLPNHIIEIQTYEFGQDVLHTDRSWDFALVSGFANLEAMQRYQRHPAHQAVVALLHELCDRTACVDFESKPLPIEERDPVEDLIKRSRP